MLKIDGKKQKLIIYNATFEDAGTYTCVVGNKKRTAKLKVEGIILYFLKLLLHFSMKYLNVCNKLKLDF